MAFDSLTTDYEYYEAPAADVQTKCYKDYTSEDVARVYPTRWLGTTIHI